MGDIYPSGRNIAVESLGQMLRSLRESAERKAQIQRQTLDWQQRMEARRATEAFRETSLEWQQAEAKEAREMRKEEQAARLAERKEAREVAATARKEEQEFREAEAEKAETHRQWLRDKDKAEKYFEEHGEYPPGYIKTPEPAAPTGVADAPGAFPLTGGSRQDRIERIARRKRMEAEAAIRQAGGREEDIMRLGQQEYDRIRDLLRGQSMKGLKKMEAELPPAPFVTAPEEAEIPEPARLPALERAAGWLAPAMGMKRPEEQEIELERLAGALHQEVLADPRRAAELGPLGPRLAFGGRIYAPPITPAELAAARRRQGLPPAGQPSARERVERVMTPAALPPGTDWTKAVPDLVTKQSRQSVNAKIEAEIRERKLTGAAAEEYRSKRWDDVVTAWHTGG